MLCQNCFRSDATMHLKRIINGETAEIHLCADCAAKLGGTGIPPGFSPLGEILGGIHVSADTKKTSNRLLRCEECGFTFDDIARTGSAGCPNCYRVFGQKLRPTLFKLHGRAVFAGKKPAAALSGVSFSEGTSVLGSTESGEHSGERSEGGEAPARTGNAAAGGGIILSSRIRLARNIDGIPFPVRLNTLRRADVNERCCRAIAKAGLPVKITDMSTLYPYEIISLAERHLISPEFASSSDGRMLLLSADGRISIMLNEDDHVRIQALENGLKLREGYENAEIYDEVLNGELHFAFDGLLGYLNQNFRDIGTGMRASVMLHLPALSRTGLMSGMASMLAKLGFNVRGSYGDAASVKGDIYRISNQVTLGITEEQAIENLEAMAMQIATKERAAAEEFVKNISVRDSINRAEALLKGALMLSTNEMMELLSWVRLGALNSLSQVSPEKINGLFVSMQPASVNVSAGRKLTSSERDEIRAEKVRETLFSSVG